MIYIKCRNCSDVHNVFTPNSFSTCGCNGRMELLSVPDEQHRKAVSALQEHMDALVTASLEFVQEIKGATELPDEYESWSANWLLKNSDARGYEDIENMCAFMNSQRDELEGDEVFDAADWAVLTADAAEKAISWFDEGNIHDAIWWIDNAVYKAEAVKGLSDYRTAENYYIKKAKVMALLKENGYDVAL